MPSIQIAMNESVTTLKQPSGRQQQLVAAKPISISHSLLNETRNPPVAFYTIYR